MNQPVTFVKWRSSIEQRFKMLGVGVIVIALYSMYQGSTTLFSTLNAFSRFELPKEIALIQISFLLVGLFAIAGSVGMVMGKKWGIKIIKWCYIAVIPFTFFGIYHSGSKDTEFIVFRVLDMLIGFSILYFLSRKSTKNRFV